LRMSARQCQCGGEAGGALQRLATIEHEASPCLSLS
jgi:hypothetical protein